MMSLGRFQSAGLLLFFVTAHAADLRVDSNLVLIPVSVTDSAYRPIVGLPASRFHIFEGRTEQAIVNVSTEDLPASIGIVFDSSGSMDGLLPNARRAVAEFLKNAASDDEFFLVSCSDRAQLAVPFTTSAPEIQNRLLFSTGQGKTPLLDAIHLAIRTMKDARHSRKALLIVSDGEDNDSRYTQSEILRVARETGIWIYGFGVESGISPILPEEEGRSKLLDDFAHATGGRHLTVRDAAALPEAAVKIAREIRSQYVLAYRPESFTPDGTFRQVQVKLTNSAGLQLSWRPGYLAR